MIPIDSTKTALSATNALQKMDMAAVNVYVEVLHRELVNMKDHIKGSVFRIIDSAALGDMNAKIAAGLDESSVDNDKGKFSLVHIEYKYEGHWYPKAKLLERLQLARTQ